MYKYMYEKRYHLSQAKNTNLGLQTTKNLGELGATTIWAAAADMLSISLRLLIVVSVFALCVR